MNIKELAHLLDGSYIGDDTALVFSLTGAGTDSRYIKEGDIFFCLTGSSVDGHNFIHEAAQRGAILAIGEKDVPSPLPYIRVNNVVESLGKLAHYKRQQYKNTVIAITGSSGKTTAKEILSHILSSAGLISKNILNYNNQIGLPLTILNAKENARAWVLELGISKAHDMEELGNITHPDIVYIVNAGNAHTEGLGEKGTAYHKASLLAYIKEGTSYFCDNAVTPMAFIPEDAPELLKESQQYGKQITTINPLTPYTIHYHGVQEDGKGLFTIDYHNTVYELVIPYSGDFMRTTLSAAIQIAEYLGIDFSHSYSALSSLPSVEQRNSVTKIQNVYVIDDTYNANPLSMKSMIHMVYSYPVEHYILYLGDMKELGEQTEQEHYLLGAYIATLFQTKKVTVLWKGLYASFVHQGLLSEGFRGELYTNPEYDVIENVIFREQLTVILCKGSRSSAVEQELSTIYSILKDNSNDI